MQIHPYYHSWQKRAFDVVLASVLLVVSTPLLVGIAVLIASIDGRPVIFAQKRLGKDKKPFTIYKFRTMRVGAERLRKKLEQHNEAPYPMFKMHNDPRFTKLGKVLSHFGLDELPQLINVLRGEMSLVGPRPLPVYEAEKLPKEWDFRYAVRPGLYSEWVINATKYTSQKSWLHIEKTSLLKGSWLSTIFLFFVIVITITKQVRNKNVTS